MSFGWSLQETKELFEAVDGKSGGSLNAAFRSIAERYNRKPNSVRNYYYSQLKAFSLLPDMAVRLGIKARLDKKEFVTFADEEVTALVKHILVEQGKGKSVRHIVTELAKGDKTLMLRYQNKYRSVIASKRGKLDSVIEELNAEHTTYRHPITGELVVRGEPSTADETTTLKLLGELLSADTRLALAKLAKENTSFAAKLEEKQEHINRLEKANRALADKLLSLTPKK